MRCKSTAAVMRVNSQNVWRLCSNTIRLYGRLLENTVVSVLRKEENFITSSVDRCWSKGGWICGCLNSTLQLSQRSLDSDTDARFFNYKKAMIQRMPRTAWALSYAAM